MKIKQLFKIPVSSLELSNKIEMEIEGVYITLILKYFDEKNKVLKLRFETVLCHMGTSKKFTKELFDAYDTLVEIEDSEWLNELKEINEEEVNFWEVKHYAIFLENSRMYQFIASGYDIIEDMTELIKRLEKKGIIFEQGLSTEEIDKIEEIYDIEFPYELKDMYMKSLPISEGFYKWRDFSDKNIEYIKYVITSPKQWIEEHTEDVYWDYHWKEEPADPKERIKRIQEKVKSAPKLIPIWGHRYMTSGRIEQKPVFSVHGTDIRHYGESLDKYLKIEFLGKHHKILPTRIKEVPFWSDIV